VLTGYLIQHSLWKRQSDRERDRLKAVQRGGRGQLQRKVKWCRHSPSPGKPTLFQRKPANGKHRQLCSDKKSHDCQNTTPFTLSEKGRRKKTYGVGGWRVMKMEDINRRGQKRENEK